MKRYTLIVYGSFGIARCPVMFATVADAESELFRALFARSWTDAMIA